VASRFLEITGSEKQKNCAENKPEESKNTISGFFQEA
jgi:hypothetical protein